MTGNVQQITALGQSLWIDFISRDVLQNGQFRAWLDAGVRGVTSNPTIFHKAISESQIYDNDIRPLIGQNKSTYEIYEALAVDDIGKAADALRPIYDQTSRLDGYVSIEVNPGLAHDTEGTVDEARRLFATLDRPNVMIKVPATEAGLPAIETLISEGINVNVTLIFSIEMYRRVAQAYIAGLRRRHQHSAAVDATASVASFFVSRVDTLVDQLLQQRIADGREDLEPLLGRAANANAKLAYAAFREIFESDGFADLRSAGARVQRPLWASTSTKNPDYSPVHYVDPLIGPHTVNTVPPTTFDDIRQHANPAVSIEQEVDGARTLFEQLAAVGIDMAAVTDQLLKEGVEKFAQSFSALLSDLEAKRERVRQSA